MEGEGFKKKRHLRQEIVCLLEASRALARGLGQVVRGDVQRLWEGCGATVQVSGAEHDARLLAKLAERSHLGALARFQVALWRRPFVPPTVLQQQNLDILSNSAGNDDARCLRRRPPVPPSPAA